MASRKLTLNIVGDTSSLERALKRSRGETSRFGSALAAVGKVAATAGLAVGTAVVGLAVKGFEAFREQQAVMAQTTAALQSTGAKAGVSAKGIDKLASELANLSGVEHTAIQRGENLLLTFTNVQNKAGEGNDIFDQATKAMLDMSTALGQDTKSSAIQLGKALNDPIRGITALRRVGVSFTAEQKEQIETLVKSGKTLEAQKLILKELATEFGGSAAAKGKTLEGQIGRLHERFRTLSMAIAGKVIPWVTKALDKALPFIDKLSSAVSNMDFSKFGRAGDYINGFIAAAKKAWTVTKPLVTSLLRFSPIFQLLSGGFAKTGDKIRGFNAAIQRISAMFRQVWATVGPIVLDMVRFINQQLAKVTAWVRHNWPLIQRTVNTVMYAIKAVFDRVWPVIAAVIRTAWTVIKTVVSSSLNAILGIIKTVMQLITGDWSGAWESLKGVVRTVLSGLVTLTGSIITGFVDIGVNIVKGLWDGIASMGAWLARKVGDWVKSVLPGPVKLALGIKSPSTVFRGIGENVAKGLASGLDSGESLVRGASRKLGDAIVRPRGAGSAGYAAEGGAVRLENVTITGRLKLAADGFADLIDARISADLAYAGAASRWQR